MDTFFTQKYCDRCGGSLKNGRTMSMLNTQTICMDCKDKEKQRDDYKNACDAELEQLKLGNHNYKGIYG